MSWLETNITSPNPFSMKILRWNCKGVLNPILFQTLKDLVDVHALNLVILLKIRLDGDHASNMIAKLPFDNWHTTKILGFAEGLWLL